ncbi:TPA: hypothetical protein DCZ15_03200 [Candidatus Falkowbacteria bacterium]|nr:MAG: hypothetical protein UV95_C0002G0026 [Candidatus Falkowbacteria bacterium GW2011_GWF2_43_32]HBA36856.1 hypothetical protein [Candidatus Falkowbacteria bacterium]
MTNKARAEIFSNLLNDATKTSEIIRKKHQIIEKKKKELNSIVEKYNSQGSIVLFSQTTPEIKAEDYHRFYPSRNYTITSVNIFALPICIGEPLTCGLMLSLSFDLEEGDKWQCSLSNLEIECKKGKNHYVVFSRGASGISSALRFLTPGDEIVIYDFSQFELIEKVIFSAFDQLGWPRDKIKIEGRP